MIRNRRKPRRVARHKRSHLRLLLDVLLAVLVLGVLALVVANERFGDTETISGAARVVDGDSLEIGSHRIRLEGMDAPELGQMCMRGAAEYPCGREARAALVELAGEGMVECRAARRDRYGRLLARCTANGVDLNRAMVERGWAVAYGDYGSSERAARNAGSGLWAGEFDRPQEWRRVHGGLAEDAHDGLSAFWDWLRTMLQGRMPLDENGGNIQ